jgi:hypothetical protein
MQAMRRRVDPAYQDIYRIDPRIFSSHGSHTFAGSLPASRLPDVEGFL